MSKLYKGIIFVGVSIIICVATYLIYVYGFNNSDNKENQNIYVENKVENKVNEVNEVKNEVLANQINVVSNQTKLEQEEPEDLENSEISSESDKERAMAIAKEAWGDPDGAYFDIQEPDADGRYKIQVTSDAKVLAWYFVNPKKGTYTVEYN